MDAHQNDYDEFMRLVDAYNKCSLVDTNSIGLIYLYLPNRHIDPHSLKDYDRNGTVFKLNNFYSLLALDKLFRRNRRERILFYYLRPHGTPTSNHYNQWLNDSFWSAKIPLDHVKFIGIDARDDVSPDTNQISLSRVLDVIVRDSASQFDNAEAKKHILLQTSDVIVGPNILNCFCEQPTQASYQSNWGESSIYATQAQVATECHRQLHRERSFYSILYKLVLFHSLLDFSGIFMWHTSATSELSYETLAVKHIKHENVYKCHYKTDLIPSPKNVNLFRPGSSRRPLSYENTYCVFGYEINNYDVPLLESLFELDENYFNMFMRKQLYGTTRSLLNSGKRSDSATKQFIPNLVHLIWFGDEYKTLKFVEYLCIKSILKVLKPDKLKIHGDVRPHRSSLWLELENHDKIEWVQIERPLFKYGQNFSNSPIQHLADLTRLEVLYNEGGLYSDLDILWVKPVDRLRYLDVDLIASNDITSYCNEFPLSIQIGAFMAPAKSPFIANWLDLYKQKYHMFPGDYAAVSMCEPYKVYEKDPRRVLIDNRLQMIFFNGWSTFIPKYLDLDQSQLIEFNRNLDWLNNGSHGYHLPRYSQLFSMRDYESADKSLLPIKIADFILGL